MWIVLTFWLGFCGNAKVALSSTYPGHWEGRGGAQFGWLDNARGVAVTQFYFNYTSGVIGLYLTLLDPKYIDHKHANLYLPLPSNINL
jgi:hypothetical protein